MAMKRKSNHEGSIQQRSANSWRAQISINGERYNFSAPTKRACQECLLSRRVEISKGYDLASGNISLAEYLDEWIQLKGRELKQNTLTQYQNLIRLKINPSIGDKKLNEITRRDIDDFYSQLINTGLGIPTIRYTHRVLHNALEEALKSDLIIKNPAKYAKPPRYDPPEMKVLEQYQISIFLGNASQSRYEAVYQLAITTGMRQGEILGLRWSDIRWQSATLNISRQVFKNDTQGFSFTSPKTKAGVRVIPVSENSLHMLRRHRDYQDQQKQFAGDKWQEHDLIFTSSIGTPIDRSNLLKDFKKLLKDSNLLPIRFHDLRHTAASIMLNNNIPILSVSRMLGHSKPSVTLDIYGHLMMGKLNEVAELMDALVTPVLVQIPKNAETHRN